VPGSMKIRTVHPSDDTPTNTITDFENVECLRKAGRVEFVTSVFWLWRTGDHSVD